MNAVMSEERVVDVVSSTREERRALLRRHGWLLLAGLRETDQVESLLAELGTLSPQDDGRLHYAVRAQRGFERRSFSGSANPLNPHTEASFRQVPPRYAALWCVRSARCGGGGTLVADGDRLISELPDHLRRLAAERLIRFDNGAGEAATAPIQTMDPGGARILRFSYNLLRFGAYHADLDSAGGFFPAADQAELADALEAGFRKNNRRIAVPRHGLLVIDNYRCLHAREGFSDPDRLLIRYWIDAAD